MSEDKLKPVFMFIWRFLFTFMSLGYLVYVLVSSSGSIHSDTYSFFIWVFIWAIVFDSGKMKARVGTVEEDFLKRNREYWDPFIPGTVSWNARRNSDI